MTAYSIDPAGVDRVLATVMERWGDLDAVRTSFTAPAEGVASAAPSLPAVAAALADNLEFEAAELDGTGQRIAACALGARRASEEYLRADVEMAARTQAAAVAAAASGDLSFFGLTGEGG